MRKLSIFGLFALCVLSGCAKTVTVRVPSPDEIQEKREQVATDASDLSKSSGELVKVYWQKAKANFCSEK